MPPKRDWRLRIGDILDNVERIQRFTWGMSFEDFVRNEEKILVVERCMLINGEAARHVPIELQARHPEIPWDDLRDTRNFVAHVYFRVSRKNHVGYASERATAARSEVACDSGAGGKVRWRRVTWR